MGFPGAPAARQQQAIDFTGEIKFSFFLKKAIDMQFALPYIRITETATPSGSAPRAVSGMPGLSAFGWWWW